MEKANRRYLANLRKELHENIFNEINNMEYKALRVVRRPNERKNQPASKIILIVKDKEQADAIEKKCDSLIVSTNKSIRKAMGDSVYSCYEVKYKIKICYSESDVVLSVHDAQRRKKKDGNEIKRKLRELQNGANVEYIEDCIQHIKDNQNYILAESTGNSYRITYFDDNCRHQVSIGNLLIVVSSSDIQILDGLPRKRRSDKKDYLYSVDIADSRVIYIYPA